MIRFNSPEEFIAALEARRKFWRAYDKRQADQHKAAEQQWLQDMRTQLREALKMNYETLSKKHRYGVSIDRPPQCPLLQEPKIDRLVTILKTTRGKSFVVDGRGSWATAYDLLVSDPDAKRSVC